MTKTLITVAAAALLSCVAAGGLWGESRYQAGYAAAEKSNPPPPDLAQPCPPLPLLSDTRGATLLMWAFDVVDLYKDCADKHQGLLKAWPD